LKNGEPNKLSKKRMINHIINSPWFLLSIISVPSVIAWINGNKHKFFAINTGYTAAYISGEIIKLVTAVSRPFATNPQILGLTTNIPHNYSFPSLHATLITVFAWALSSIAPPLSWLSFTIAFLISLSRIYLGVHYYFDVVGGFLLGTFIFWISYILFQPNEIFPIDANPNIRRKIFHLIYGLVLALLIHYQVITPFQLGTITLAFGGYVLLSRYKKLTKISNLVSYFERNPKTKYLGLGPLFFLVSSLATTLVFPNPIAVAAILNLAIGDSINALLGHFWHQPNIWQKVAGKPTPKKKRISAAVAAAIATVIITLYYVTPVQAVVGAVATFILEFSAPRIGNKELDDNLLIPTISGLAMSLV